MQQLPAGSTGGIAFAGQWPPRERAISSRLPPRRRLQSSGGRAGIVFAARDREEGDSIMGTMLELTAGDGFRLSAYGADPPGAPR